jgi:hypothetical protein
MVPSAWQWPTPIWAHNPGRRIGVAGADQVTPGTDKNEVIRVRDVAAVALAQFSVGLDYEDVDIYHSPLRT